MARAPSGSVCCKCQKSIPYPPIKLPETILSRDPSGLLNVLYQLYCIRCAKKEIGWWWWEGPLIRKTRTSILGFPEFRRKEEESGRKEEAGPSP